MTRAATVFALVCALLIAVPGAAYARVLSTRHAACADEEDQTGVATSWSPWAGCHATIFGTDLKVGP